MRVQRKLGTEADRFQLPVYEAKNDILRGFEQSQVTIIIGETGSGKTTQIPQLLHEAGYTRRGMVAVTQPRRVAAITVSSRVAYEMNTKLGEEVGYCIRFEDVTSRRTRVKYMTDGMLLREALLDPTLSRYSAILLDEAHERSLHTDALLGIVKRVLPSRPDLKVAVMSATLDPTRFSEFFNNAPVLYIEGRQYGVEVYYTPEAEQDYLDAALIATLQIHLFEPPGDILVFLTGQDEIEGLHKIVREKAMKLPQSALKLDVCMLFGALPWEQQAHVFESSPVGVRKVILATNIAETSLTINGVRYVVDTGLVKSKGYNARIGLESLMVSPISRAAAIQRAGRSARQGPGRCYRLYTEDTYLSLPETTPPEIQRCNLASVVLQLKVLGISDVLNFDFMDAPPKHALVRALELLFSLDALDQKGSLTPVGRRMAEFPLEPMYAKAILAAQSFGCVADMLSVVAMLSVESVFFTPRSKRDDALAARRQFAHIDGDHITLLNVYKAYVDAKRSRQWCSERFINAASMAKVTEMRKQLEQISVKGGLPVACSSASAAADSAPLRRCLASAFFPHAAQLLPTGGYRTLASNQEVLMHPSSVLFARKPPPPCVVYNSLVLTTKQYMRDVTAIDASWLAELAPCFYRSLPQPSPAHEGPLPSS